MSHRNQIDQNIYIWLDELKSVPSRNATEAQKGRMRFLSEAEKLERNAFSKIQSHNRWKISFFENKAAFKAVVAMLMIGILLFAGSVTIAAAQNDLPNETLYPVKLWTESATLTLTRTPLAKAELLMQMSEKRVDEITALAEKGLAPPEQVFNLLEQHIQQILVLASNMGDDALTQTLLQLREHLQSQEQRIAQIHFYANAKTEELFSQTRQNLQAQLQSVNYGLSDPQGFRDRMKKSNNKAPNLEETATPGANQTQGPNHRQENNNSQTPSSPGNGNNPGSGTPNGQPTPHPQINDGTGSGKNGNDSEKKDGSKKDNGTGKDGDNGGSGKKP